jgi:hypothetical protein
VRPSEQAPAAAQSNARLGLRIFEASGLTSPILARSTATGCCACAAKAPRSSSSRCHQRSAAPSTGLSAPAPAANPPEPPRRPDGPPRRHPPTAAARRNCRGPNRQAAPSSAQAHLRHDHARRRGGPPARRPDRRPPRRPPGPRCATTGRARTSTATLTTSSPHTWHPAPDQPGASPVLDDRETPGIASSSLMSCLFLHTQAPIGMIQYDVQ